MFHMLGCEDRKMALRELSHPSAQLVVLGVLCTYSEVRGKTGRKIAPHNFEKVGALDN